MDHDHCQNLPLDADYLTEDLRVRAKDELNEDDESRDTCLRLLKLMIGDTKIPTSKTGESFLMAYLRSKKFDVDRAFAAYKTFYTLLAKNPKVFKDFEFSDVLETLENREYGFLGSRDKHGCVTFVVITGNWEPTKRNCSMWCCIRAVMFCILWACLSPATQVAGINVILDIRGVHVSHWRYIPVDSLWAIVQGVQNSFPGRFRGIHFIYDSPLFKAAWFVIKPLLSEKMKGRVYVHGDDVMKLHEHFPPDSLPSNFGGSRPAFNKGPWRETFSRTSDELMDIFRHRLQTV